MRPGGDSKLQSYFVQATNDTPYNNFPMKGMPVTVQHHPPSYSVLAVLVHLTPLAEAPISIRVESPGGPFDTVDSDLPLPRDT